MFVVRKWCDQLYSYGGKINRAVFAISNKCLFLYWLYVIHYIFIPLNSNSTIICSGSRDGRQLKVQIMLVVGCSITMSSMCEVRICSYSQLLTAGLYEKRQAGPLLVVPGTAGYCRPPPPAASITEENGHLVLFYHYYKMQRSDWSFFSPFNKLITSVGGMKV